MIFTNIMNVYFGLRFRDINCAYKLMRRQDIQGFGLKINGPLINAEILIKAQKKGLSIKECPIFHYPRLYGQSTGAKISTIVKAIQDFFRLLSAR